MKNKTVYIAYGELFLILLAYYIDIEEAVFDGWYAFTESKKSHLH